MMVWESTCTAQVTSDTISFMFCHTWCEARQLFEFTFSCTSVKFPSLLNIFHCSTCEIFARR